MAPTAKAKNVTLPATEKPPETSPGLLTPAELAARLRVAESWVREKTRERARLRDRDPLPVVRLGKYVRFSWAAVEAWLARQ
jgi:excisionase family DNA binding protein